MHRGGAEVAIQLVTSRNVLICFWGRRGGGPRYTYEVIRSLADLEVVNLHVSLSRQSAFWGQTDAVGLPSCHVDTYTNRFGLVRSLHRMSALSSKLSRYVSAESIDVVLLTMWHPWWPAVVAAARGGGAHLVLVEHEEPGRLDSGLILQSFGCGYRLHSASHIVTLSNFVARRVASTYGIPSSRMTVVPHPRFAPDEELLTARRHPGARKEFRILFFGRLTRRKGLSLLAEAYADLVRTRPWLRLSIIGPGNASVVRKIVGRLPGVELSAKYLEEGQVHEAFSRSNLVVLPYLRASQSGVAALAYGAGLPMVATPVGGLPEQVRHGRTGCVCSSVTPAALASTLASLIDHPLLYDRIAEAVLRVGVSEYGRKATGQRFAMLCNNPNLSFRSVNGED